jgi:DME family drug/metabolite transporter
LRSSIAALSTVTYVVISLPFGVKRLSGFWVASPRLQKKNTVALAQTALTAILWGTSFPVITFGIDSGLDPRAFAFLRFAVAAPLMLAACRVYGRSVKGLLRSRAVWVIAFFNATGFVCQFVGQAYTSASVAALLVNLSVVFAALGGTALLNEKMGIAKVSGVVFALIGTVLLATKGDLSLVTSGQLLGDGLYLVAAVSWGGYVVYAKKKTDETAWDPVAVSASIITATVMFIFPVALTADWNAPIPIGGWEAVIYTGFFSTAIAFALYQSGLRYLTATSSAVVLMLEIVTAVAISTIFLGEVLNLYSWVGAALVILSVFLVSGVEVSGKSLSVSENKAGGVKVL